MTTHNPVSSFYLRCCCTSTHSTRHFSHKTHKRRGCSIFHRGGDEVCLYPGGMGGPERRKSVTFQRQLFWFGDGSLNSETRLAITSGWSVTRKTEKPTENSKTRTEPKPKITDFSKTEPNRNRIQKPRLTEKGHFWKFWVKSGRKSEKILRFRLVLLKKHSNPKKFLQKCCKLSFKHLLALLKKCRILSQFLSTNADG